jgi:hypothetical protein
MKVCLSETDSSKGVVLWAKQGGVLHSDGRRHVQ